MTTCIANDIFMLLQYNVFSLIDTQLELQYVPIVGALS